jgi:hypothetical protein
MPLVSQAEYARQRKVSKEAVRKRTTTMGGPIPVHGRLKMVDPEEADRLWRATMSPAGASTSRFEAPGDEPAPESTSAAAAAFLGNATALTQARTALLLTEAQLRRLRLEERRGALLDRQTTLAKFFSVVRMMRDGWLAWPSRVGPEIAAKFGIDQTQLMIVLEHYVRRQLDEFAGVRLDLDGRRPQS